MLDLAAFIPGSVLDLVAKSPALAERISAPVQSFLRERSLARLREILMPIADALITTRPFPFPLDYLPSGLFDNSSIERYLRLNLERQHMPNSFKALYQARKKELYIVAIKHGADLIICYNPFRPFSNRVVRKYDPQKDDYVAESMQLADRGMLMILNQVLRTLLHSRLQLGLRQYQDDPNFKGDIILIEPTENDIDFFQMTPLAFWERRRAAQHGYLSVTQSIDTHYDMMRRILESYGILMTRKTVSEGVQRMQAADTPEEASDVLMREVPKRDLSVAEA